MKLCAARRRNLVGSSSSSSSNKKNSISTRASPSTTTSRNMNHHSSSNSNNSRIAPSPAKTSDNSGPQSAVSSSKHAVEQEGPALCSTLSCTASSSTTSSAAFISNTEMSDDLLLTMCSYLDCHTVCTVLVAVNRRFRNLLWRHDIMSTTDEDDRMMIESTISSSITPGLLWRHMMHRQWPWLLHSLPNAPVAITFYHDNNNNNNCHDTKSNKKKKKKRNQLLKQQQQFQLLSSNMNRLLMLASKKSSKVDESLLDHMPKAWTVNNNNSTTMASQSTTSSSRRLHHHHHRPVVNTSVLTTVPVVTAAGDSLASSPQVVITPTTTVSTRTTAPLDGSTATTTNDHHRDVVVIPDVAVVFTGQVGKENRSFRADAALPRPTLVYQKKKKRHHLWRPRRVHVRPFVAPFRRRRQQPPKLKVVSPSSSSCSAEHGSRRYYDNTAAPAAVVIDLTPRLISYFEVSIHEGSTTSSKPVAPVPVTLAEHLARTEQGAGATAAHHQQQQPECIAIGVATSSFGLRTRMPGWDKTSCGYHGDDGSVYHHGSGDSSPQRDFGPTFGAGDTVGCGIDYSNVGGGTSATTGARIFFTLNGRYLGTASHQVDATQDWYPVVGMDSNCLAVCNFGVSKPFQYDLAQALGQRQAATMKALAATT